MTSDLKESPVSLYELGKSAVLALQSRFSGKRSQNVSRVLDLLELGDRRTTFLNQKLSEIESERALLQDHLDQARADILGQKQKVSILKAEHAALDQKNQDLTNQLNEVIVERIDLQDRLKRTIAENTEYALQQKSLIKQQSELQKAKRTTEEKYGKLHVDYLQLKDTAESLHTQLDELIVECNSQQDRLALSLKEKVEINEMLAAVQEQQQLVSSLLSAEPPCDLRLHRLRRWLEEDFSEWLHALPLGSVGTEAREWAQSLVDRVVLRQRVPAFRGKTVVAVAGGFSSGKSSFITSLMHAPDGRTLPVGIKPVTAVPTYIVSGTEEQILAHTANGGVVPLGMDWFKTLSHQALKSLEFKLQSILPFITLESALISPVGKTLQNIAFIDLPGFNAPSSIDGHEADDTETALEFLIQADAVVWAIGLDANGTVPQTDLNKLLELQDFGLSCYILLTKADLRHPTALTKLLEHIHSILDQEGIEVLGIGAHSSTDSSLIHHYIGKSIDDFMCELDKPNSWEAAIQQEIEDEFKKLELAAENIRNREQLAIKELKGLELDLFERTDTAEPMNHTKEKDISATRVAPIFSSFFSTFFTENPTTGANSTECEIDKLDADECLRRRISFLVELLSSETHFNAAKQPVDALRQLRIKLDEVLKDPNANAFTA